MNKSNISNISTVYFGIDNKRKPSEVIKPCDKPNKKKKITCTNNSNDDDDETEESPFKIPNIFKHDDESCQW